MKRVMIDFAFIVVLTALYFGLILFAVSSKMPESLGVTPVDGNTFYDDFSFWSMIVAGIAALAVVTWYVLGEWGPRAHRTSQGTWMAIWLVLLAVVILAGVAAMLWGPQASENPVVLALFYFGGGIIFFWFVTMLFSPVGIKTLPPLARLVRRW